MTDDLKQRLRAVCETGCDPDLPFEAADRIEQLEAERDELKADAMRYRWLKQYEKQNWSGFTTNMRHKEWDSAIDAAIAKERSDEHSRQRSLRKLV